jgi:hypothetical protein
VIDFNILKSNEEAKRTLEMIAQYSQDFTWTILNSPTASSKNKSSQVRG